MSNESMLKGGDDVPILPNQAGGGESMLQGGDQAKILPNQAGGADYSALENDFTSKEQDQIKIAAGVAYIQSKDIPNLTAQQITDISIAAANTKAEELLKQTNGTGDVTAHPTQEEKDAAIAAINAAKNDDRFKAEFKEADQPEALHRVAIAAILRKRRENNIKIVANSAAKKDQRIKAMTTPAAEKIIPLESTIVYTEFYHISDIETTSEIDKYRQIIAGKFEELNDEIGAQKMRVNMYTEVDKYRQTRLKEWSSVYRNTNRKVATLIPTIRDNVQFSENEILTMYSRFIYCLPWELEKIVVIPPIRGKVDIFINVLYRLNKIGALTHKKIGGKDRYKIKTGIAIVFMPSFYADINITDPKELDDRIKANKLLFSIFIDMNYSNTNKIFILSENTAANYTVGVMLSKMFSRHDIFKTSPLTMLEPSYIIYPYTRSGLEDGIVISGSTAAEPALPKITNFGLADLKTSNTYGKPLGLSVKPNGSNDFESGDIFAIRSTTDDGGVKQNMQYDFSQAPGPCDGLLQSKSPELSKLKRENNAFYLKPVNITKDANDKVLENQNVVMVIQFNPTGDHAPLCTTALTSAPEPLGSDDIHVASKKFKDGDRIVNPIGNKVQIEIRGTLYSIRQSSHENNVKNDWEKREFTEDEAAFLNSTRLRPGVLQDCFGDTWTKRLSEFLETFTTARCMSDTSLLTNSECYNCRKFLEDVNLYFINKQLRLDLSNPEFDQYAKEVYENTEEPPLKIEADHAKEANAFERSKHKQFFGTISSYDNVETRERRAFIIGVNKKTHTYKYYVISVPSDLKEESRKKDEEELQKKINLQLQVKYKDMMFIY